MTGYTGNVAKKYYGGDAHTHPWNAQTYKTWAGKIGNVDGKWVLDLACGAGHTSRLLAHKGAVVIGVDISEDGIRAARSMENPTTVRYVCRNAARYRAGFTFDCVSASFLFHYASRLDEMLDFANTANVHLPMGGRLVALHSLDSIVPKIENGSHWSEWINPADKTEGAGVRLHILNGMGEEVVPIDYYHWKQKTYDCVLARAGFGDIVRIRHKIPAELKDIYPNWRELQNHNASCVLVATKIFEV